MRDSIPQSTIAPSPVRGVSPAPKKGVSPLLLAGGAVALAAIGYFVFFRKKKGRR